MVTWTSSWFYYKNLSRCTVTWTSSWFYYKNLSRCTVTWTSNAVVRLEVSAERVVVVHQDCKVTWNSKLHSQLKVSYFKKPFSPNTAFSLYKQFSFYNSRYVFRPVGSWRGEAVTLTLAVNEIGTVQCTYMRNCEKRLLASSCLSIRLSVRMEQLGPNRTDFHEIWYFNIFLKYVEKEKKVLSTPSFGGEVKLSVPCCRFAASKRSLNLRGSRNLSKNYRTNFSPTVPPSAARISRVVADVQAPGGESGNV